MVEGTKGLSAKCPKIIFKNLILKIEVFRDIPQSDCTLIEKNYRPVQPRRDIVVKVYGYEDKHEEQPLPLN